MSDAWPCLLTRYFSTSLDEGTYPLAVISHVIHGKHTAYPSCVGPLIGTYVRTGGELMPNEIRQRLLPYLPRIADSCSAQHEEARARIMWLYGVQTFAPYALDAVGLHSEATRLRSLRSDVTYSKAKEAVLEVKRTIGYYEWSSSLKIERTRRERRETARIVAVSANHADNTMRYLVRITQCAKGLVYTKAKSNKGTNTALGYSSNSNAALTNIGSGLASMAHGATETIECMAKIAKAEKDVVEDRCNAIWDDYFTCLDEVLKAGPEGPLWTPEMIQTGYVSYQAAKEEEELQKKRETQWSE